MLAHPANFEDSNFSLAYRSFQQKKLSTKELAKTFPWKIVLF